MSHASATTIQQASWLLLKALHRTPFVETGSDNLAYWDRGDPHLNTAFAMLALLNMSRGQELVPQAARYLISQQDLDSGAWASACLRSLRTKKSAATARAFSTAKVRKAIA